MNSAGLSPDLIAGLKAKGLRVRPWRSGTLQPYNGFTHVERVRGWQAVSLLMDSGVMQRPEVCCITGATRNVNYHDEDYYRLTPYPLCFTVHSALHRRFRQPQAWQRIVDAYARTGEEWFARLSPTPIDLAGQLREQCGDRIADVLTRTAVELIGARY